jgi:hypothetical protein
MTKLAGTFVEETPGPGATHHQVAVGNITFCSLIVGAGWDWITTDQMPAFKVCETCRRKAMTFNFMARIDAIMAAR